MRVEYKNPEILKRPDTRIVLKDVQGIWEADTKTLRIYYEGIIQNIPTTIVSTDGDEILELILEGERSELGNCGNIIYIEFPLDTEADISLSCTSNITYLESRGYAIGENILRGINATSKSRLKKFISKASWYRYFRINRLTRSTNLKRLDWAGRSISKDYYERRYSNLQLFCDGMDENSLIVYDFKMSTPCITFYGFATEETWKVEGNNRKLVSREVVSLENVPGLTITDLPGATPNFIVSIDSENLRAELLTIQNFDPQETETIYRAEFIAEVYDYLGQKETSRPIEITTLSELLDWNWDRERSTTMFVEGDSPVFLFRHDDFPRGVYHTLRVITTRTIDNIDEVSIEPIDDPYFTYDRKLDINSSGGNDIVINIYPRSSNPTSSWIPRLYADVPEPRSVKYKSHKLNFYPIIGPRNTNLYIIEPDDPEENEIDALELPNDILGGNYIVKTEGEDTYWGGFATNSKVYTTKWGYTGYVKPEDTEEDTTVVTPEDNPQPVVEQTNFDIPDSNTSGAKTDGLWIFPCSCSVRPGQLFTLSTAEVKGSRAIWCRESHVGSAAVNELTAGEAHAAATAGGSSSSYVSRGGTSNTTGSGQVTRQAGGGTTSTPGPTLSGTTTVYGCFEKTTWKAPSATGTYKLKVRGKKDQSKEGYCIVTVTGTPDTSGDPLYIRGATNMIVFRKDGERAPSASVTEMGYYNVGYFLLKVYTYRASNPNNPTLITNFGSPDCEYTWTLSKSGIVDGIVCTDQGLKILCGYGDYGVTELIIYRKSDPSIYVDIPVVLFGGKYTHYQSSLK